ncbi:hypothetical protein OG429_20750 [Streptomyces sp. NBC_00190]|uniref:hypothetical protein n=1 Tax=unclassified Streptomyces TaxID=2593676 RepID=UPI002E28FBA4|nr:hypothetical protein [Streptomyces sp. NBC_00190]WSZ41493.1 hypothetical protein OG239_23530 [Streptomyces sp. NBC_00868]
MSGSRLVKAVIAVPLLLCAGFLCLAGWIAVSWMNHLPGEPEPVDCAEAFAFARLPAPQGARDAACERSRWMDTTYTGTFRMDAEAAREWIARSRPATPPSTTPGAPPSTPPSTTPGAPPATPPSTAPATVSAGSACPAGADNGCVSTDTSHPPAGTAVSVRVGLGSGHGDDGSVLVAVEAFDM